MYSPKTNTPQAFEYSGQSPSNGFPIPQQSAQATKLPSLAELLGGAVASSDTTSRKRKREHTETFMPPQKRAPIPEDQMRLLSHWSQYYHQNTQDLSVTPQSHAISHIAASPLFSPSHDHMQQLFQSAQRLVQQSTPQTPAVTPPTQFAMQASFHTIQTASPPVQYVVTESNAPVSSAIAAPPLDDLLIKDLLVNLRSPHVLKKSFPVSVLARETGLMSEQKKDWRYRDLKRSLFSTKMSPEHLQFINEVVPHSVLQKRLAHNVTLINFCKRIHLLVFHFILRDGKLPRFYKNANARVFSETLHAHDPEFLTSFNEDVAFLTHQYILNGMPVGKALEEARKVGSAKREAADEL